MPRIPFSQVLVILTWISYNYHAALPDQLLLIPRSLAMLSSLLGLPASWVPDSIMTDALIHPGCWLGCWHLWPADIPLSCHSVMRSDGFNSVGTFFVMLINVLNIQIMTVAHCNNARGRAQLISCCTIRPPFHLFDSLFNELCLCCGVFFSENGIIMHCTKFV